MLTNFAAKVQQRSWVNCVCTHTCRFLDTYDRSFWVLLGDLPLLFSCELILLFPRSWICFAQLAPLAIALSRRHVSRSLHWTCIVLHFFVYRHTSSQCLRFCQLSQPSCSFFVFLNFPICVLVFPPLLFVQPVLLHSWNMFPKTCILFWSTFDYHPAVHCFCSFVCYLFIFSTHNTFLLQIDSTSLVHSAALLIFCSLPGKCTCALLQMLLFFVLVPFSVTWSSIQLGWPPLPMKALFLALLFPTC